MKLYKDDIDRIFSQTGPVEGWDMFRINHMRQKWENIMKNQSDRLEDWKANAEDWELQMMLNAELPDSIIEMNKDRWGFRRDRGFVDENGNIVEDIWFSTFMLAFAKMVEEDTTKLFFKKDKEGIWWLEDNPKAAKIDSQNYITGDPDFIMKSERYNDDYTVYVEQKCVYREDWKLSIRQSQMTLFDKLIDVGNKIYILVKVSLEDRDEYSFYNWEKVRGLLNVEYNTYRTTRQILEFNNVYPQVKNIDFHNKIFKKFEYYKEENL
jgi:hypothetical protein